MDEKTECIRALEENSRLSIPTEIRAFDMALERLVGGRLLTPSDLPILFRIFRDDCEDEEVMFGLVHLVENFPLEDFLTGFLRAVPEMCERAPEWTRIFHYRVINSQSAREMIKALLPQQDIVVRQTVRAVLLHIVSTEGPILAERARNLMEAVCPGQAEMKPPYFRPE